jgi:hypothetical protein
MIDTKICSRCGIVKLTTNFYKRKDGSCQSYCKTCCKLYKAIYAVENKEKLAITNKQYYEENKEEILQKNRPRNKEYHASHKTEISKRKKKYRIDNNDILIEKRKANREIINERDRKKKATNPAYKLRKHISTVIYQALKKIGASKKGNSILPFLPYSFQELKNHLERQFEPWMTWSNWGLYNPANWDDNNSFTWTWHIDHIIPQSVLPYMSMNDDNFKKCWALDNLRPLSAKQNIIDGGSKIRR